VTSAPSFKFRFRLAARQPGKLPFSESKVQIEVSDSLTLEVVARNSETLNGATNFHIDGVGFMSPEAAVLAAEALRVRLRILNAIFGLGLNIPVGDKITAELSEEVKTKLKSEQGITVVDSVWGKSVFPNDGLHSECVVSGNAVVSPGDPEFLVEAIKTLWAVDVTLDKPSEDALQILSLATWETSDRAAFLTSYLALEQLVDRRPLSDKAKKVLQRFQEELKIKRSDFSLSSDETKSLEGSLGSLQKESFSTALKRLGKEIATPVEIHGMPIPDFLSYCIIARNNIAHTAEPETKVPLGKLSDALREFVVMLIWTRNKLPSLTMNRPPSAVSTGCLFIQFM
jgi:hypothetical protein